MILRLHLLTTYTTTNHHYPNNSAQAKLWSAMRVVELPKPATAKMEEIGAAPYHYLYVCRK